MSTTAIVYVYFLYGLAFFSMGLAILLELGRSPVSRLRHALPSLAVFGILHGLHEWIEMFDLLGLNPLQLGSTELWESLRVLWLALSFLPLSGFGVFLLAPDLRLRRLGLLVPVLQVGVWAVGLFVMRDWASGRLALWPMADVWTRYVLGIFAALLACAGLISQQREFRQAGLISFGRDSLWAAVAFAWYGLIGQLFTRASPLFPSTVLNADLFQAAFGLPIQSVRAVAAVAAAFFVIRSLRSFAVVTQQQIAELQQARVDEAERREAQRGELLRRVVAAQEAERQRIARELHDATGQALTALGLGLRSAGRGLDSKPAAGQMRDLERLTANTLDELRHLIADLRPSHLDDLGLAAALRWYATDLRARGQLDVQVSLAGDERSLPSPIQIALFRVAQEALTNVAKHSGTRQAALQLCFGPHDVVLEIRDDGCGFDPLSQAGEDRPAWGLLGMQERAALLGGECRVESRPGAGTQVRVSIPYTVQEAA